MSPNPKPIKRCAIYTRKSSEEGLEQSFKLPPCSAGGLRGLYHKSTP
jgi:hypothetical protein